MVLLSGPIFFFFLSWLGQSLLCAFSHASTSQLSSPTKKKSNSKKSLSSPFYYFFMPLLEVFVFKSQWSRFTSSSTGTNKAESSLRRHWQLKIASESHSSSSLSLLSFPALFIAVVHCHPLFPNLDFCSIYQISSSSSSPSPSHISVLLCFFVCP